MPTENDEIRKLKAEIKQLRAELDGLKKFVKHESDDMTRHVVEIHKISCERDKYIVNIQQDIIDIFKYIWPMVDRVLPEFSKEMRNINKITHSGKPRA